MTLDTLRSFNVLHDLCEDLQFRSQMSFWGLKKILVKQMAVF